MFWHFSLSHKQKSSFNLIMLQNWNFWKFSKDKINAPGEKHIRLSAGVYWDPTSALWQLAASSRSAFEKLGPRSNHAAVHLCGTVTPLSLVCTKINYKYQQAVVWNPFVFPFACRMSPWLFSLKSKIAPTSSSQEISGMEKNKGRIPKDTEHTICGILLGHSQKVRCVSYTDCWISRHQ